MLRLFLELIISRFVSFQCGAIAAAIFGDRRLMLMSYWNLDNRFNALLDGEHDVQFKNDFTASRDIREVRNKVLNLFAKQ